MAVVFVSHASADRALVDEFVDLILRNGCDLQPNEIFYSSGADTGVPDGQDLLAHVRNEVSETGIVIAMLTPIFQTRPVCVAELGAAWGHTGKLLPLLLPGMHRRELEGVLSTQLVEYMDEEGALDRLHEKVLGVTGRRVQAVTWTRAKRRWVKRLTEIVEGGGIAPADTVTVADYEAIAAQRDDLDAALASAEDELDRLRQQLEAVAALKDADEVAQVLLPTDATERFEALVDDARKHLARLGNNLVAQVIVAEFSETKGLPIPSDEWERQQVLELVDKGLLTPDDGLVCASERSPGIRERSSGHQAGSRRQSGRFRL